MRRIISLKDGWKQEVSQIGEKNFSLPLRFSFADAPEVFTCTHALHIPEADKNGVCFLELSYLCGSVKVFIDGETAGELNAVLAPVMLDISDFIKKDRSQELRLEIQPRENAEGDFSFGRAALITAGRSHFDLALSSNPLDVRTVFSQSETGIYVKAQVVNPNNYDVVVFRLFSPEGILLDTKTARPTQCAAAFSLVSPSLWEGLHSNFKYRIEAILQRDAEILDHVSVHFGVRNAELSPDGFYRLNGLRLPLNGVALRDTKNVSDAMGTLSLLDANALILSSLDPEERLLDLADDLGILLIFRFPCTGEERDFPEIKRLLRAVSSHPSFAFLAYQGDNLNYVKNFCRTVRENSRDVFTVGISDILRENTLTNAVPDALMFHVSTSPEGYDFESVSSRFEEVRRDHPEYRFIVSMDPPECIFDRHSEGARRPDCSQEYFSLWHEKMWNIFGTKKGVIAYSAGFLNDESPVSGRTGLTTCDTESKKDAFWFYRAHFSGKGFVKMASLPTMVTKKYADLKCYTNLGKLNLTVNGKTDKKKKPVRLSENVYEFRGIRLKRKNNTLVLSGDSATDSAVVFRSKSKLEKR